MRSLIFFEKMKKIIGLTYDLKENWKLNPGDPEDLNAEHDSGPTVDEIARAFEKDGHVVKRIGNAENLLRNIPDLGVDVVFNIAEGRFGRNRESQIPLLLEMHGIPFVGADALTLGVTLDKIIAKKCFIADGIPTPRYFEAFSTDNLKTLNTIGFPLMVKPRFEGTSKGLTENSRVTDFEGLKYQVGLINKKYRQSALVEEFIRGSEYTVGVIGNGHAEAMPVVQVNIDGKHKLGDVFFTSVRVTKQKDTVDYVCPAQIPEQLSRTMRELAIKAYKSVDCRDFGRVDFRVDEKGSPYVLEINPLPSLSTEDAFFFIAKAIGINYEEIINKILNAGLARLGLSNGKMSEAAA